MTRYCGGYIFIVTELGDEGCLFASAKWWVMERRKVRACVAEGILDTIAKLWEDVAWNSFGLANVILGPR
jgi:hypothetical protein